MDRKKRNRKTFGPYKLAGNDRPRGTREMPSIATASLLLTVDQTGWDAGLKKSEDALNKSAARSKASADKLAKDMSKATPQVKQQTAIPSSMAGIGTALMPPALAASLSLVKELAGAFKACLDSMMQTVKVSRELGTTVQGFSQIEYAAKMAAVGSEDLQAGIAALGERLNASDAPALFKQLGLDADKLRSMGIVEQFAQISDAYNNMAQSGKKNVLFMEIFGASAAKLIPLLERSGDLIRQNASAKGATITDNDVAWIKKANEQIVEMQGNYSTLGTKASWVLSKLANDFFEGGRLTFKGVNYAADSLSWGVGMGSRLNPDYGKKVFTQPKDEFKGESWNSPLLKPEVKPWMGKGHAPLVLHPDRMPKASTSGDGIDREMSRLNQATHLALVQFKKDYRDAIATVGMTGPELKIFNLEKAGVKGALLDSLKELKAEANVIALGLVELTPLQMFKKQMDALTGARKALGDNRFNMGVNKAAQGLIQASGIGPQRTVGALVKDSSAAVSAIIASELQDRFDSDPAAQLREAQTALLEQAKQQTQFGAKTADYLRQLVEQGGKLEQEF